MTAGYSRRQLILQALLDRVATITTVNGYQTDAGQAVFLGEQPTLGPDDPDEVITILVGDDQVRYIGENVSLVLPVQFQALAKATLEQPYLAAEAVLADVKQAIEQADRTLGGLVPRQIERGSTRTVPRREGHLAVGVAIFYNVPYLETWGEP